METTLLTVNNVWMMICTALVFFMHLGFSFLEIGLTRQKNTVNILFKNFFIITMGLLVYALGGFNLMYPGFADGSMGIFSFCWFRNAALREVWILDMQTEGTLGGLTSFFKECSLLQLLPLCQELLLNELNSPPLCSFQ